MKKKNENWKEQCSKIEENLRNKNSQRAYQLVKDLTTVKQKKSYYCPTFFREIVQQLNTNHFRSKILEFNEAFFPLISFAFLARHV